MLEIPVGERSAAGYLREVHLSQILVADAREIGSFLAPDAAHRVAAEAARGEERRLRLDQVGCCDAGGEIGPQRRAIGIGDRAE